MGKQIKVPVKDNPKINDLIFKELLKRGYSLEGNTRVWNIADSKLWYLTPEQAEAYLDVEDSKSYQKLASGAEFELIENHVLEIKNQLPINHLNIVDLGCGDGQKAAHIIKKLSGSYVKIKYCPIDISGYMVSKAVKTVSNIPGVDEVVETQWNISDFENLGNITSLLNTDKDTRNLFLLLGYTLGNFEIHDLLYQIRSSMRDGDLLIIVTGVGSNKWDQWTKNQENNKKLDAFFRHTPELLGLDDKNLKFGARLVNNRVEYYYTILQDKLITFQNKTVDFNQGDQIIVAVSYKHEKDDFISYLNMHFNEVSSFLSKDKATILALCKK